MRRFLLRSLLALAGLGVIAAIGLAIASALVRFDLAAIPPETAVLNRARLPDDVAWDVMGRSVSPSEAVTLAGTPQGEAAFSPAAGAIRIDDALIRRGRDAFYRETFGNEVFFSDILGVLDGGLSAFGFATAVSALAGRGTDDLQVRLSRDVKIGERLYRAGETVRTGLDVPKGEMVPLGIRLFYDRGRIRVGVTCALCHSTVDKATGAVIEGAPNTDLEAGLLLALAANPAAVWPQTGLQSLKDYQTIADRFVRLSVGGTELLPDPAPLAEAIRAMLATWPAGSVDTTADLITNPTSIPSTFTRHAWPYGWSGQAAIGPFRGLAALSDLVHGIGNDATALAPAAQALFGVDPELYLAALLQDAPGSAFRFDPASGAKASETFASADPNPGAPGVGRFVAMPGFVRANYVTANGLIPIQPERPVTEAMAALAAFQNELRPPRAHSDPPRPTEPDPTTIELGRGVFARAGCVACHDGPALTSHRVWPVDVIGTEASRAGAFSNREAQIAKPQIFASDIRMPLPAEPTLVPVPIPDEGQLKLAWAHNQTRGGYKVPSLLALRWTAPYLHDGGVAVGPDPERRAGLAATRLAGIAPDPRNSLRALVDRDLRSQVVEANKANATLVKARAVGEGHPFWADQQAGYSEAEREALLDYLLSVDGPQVVVAPGPALPATLPPPSGAPSSPRRP